LLASGGLERGRVVVACVADEEHGSVGADALVREWRADAAVVTEPTDLQIGVAHKGFTWLEVTTRGRAAHGSRPADGRDAIFRMARVATALEALDLSLQGGTRHPSLGAASLHASTIEGGREWSSYPDRCVLQVERRTLPGEDPKRPLAEVRAILDALRGRDAEFDGEVREVFARAPYELDGRAELPQALAGCARAAGLAAPLVGMSFWTDAAILAAAGIPSVLFGPGGAGLHSPVEYVTLADVLVCRDVLGRLAREYC
jgi:acetylornithine deacetylase